jgi:serine/threonine protein kinase
MSDEYTPTSMPTEQPIETTRLPYWLEDLQTVYDPLARHLGSEFQLTGWREGGFGVVFFLQDMHTQSEYAVKTPKPQYRPGSELVVGFGREAEFWINLEPHPNIVTAYSVEVLDGRPYLFMESVGGPQPSLRERITSLSGRKGRGERDDPTHSPGDLLASALKSQTPDLATILAYTHQVCLGMQFASREQEVAHRDLKPDNILVTPGGVAKITDFGLAYTVMEVEGTYEHQQFGSWAYAPPERFTGQAEDARGDIYSLGVILYQLLTGELPYPFDVSPVPGRAYVQLKEFHTQDGMEAVGEDLYWNKALQAVDPENNIGQLLDSCLNHNVCDRYDSFGHIRATIETLFHLDGEQMQAHSLSLESMRSRAVSYFCLGNHSRALAKLNRLLVIYPDEASLWLDAARLYHDLGQPSVSRKLCERALAIDPELPEAKRMASGTKNGG